MVACWVCGRADLYCEYACKVCMGSRRVDKGMHQQAEGVVLPVPRGTRGVDDLVDSSAQEICCSGRQCAKMVEPAVVLRLLGTLRLLLRHFDDLSLSNVKASRRASV